MRRVHAVLACAVLSSLACDGRGGATPQQALADAAPTVVTVPPVALSPRDAGREASVAAPGWAPPAPYSIIARGHTTGQKIEVYPVGDRFILATEVDDHAHLAIVTGDEITPLTTAGLPALGRVISKTPDPLFSKPNPKISLPTDKVTANESGEWSAGMRELGAVAGEWPSSVFLTIDRYAWEPLVWRVSEIYRLVSDRWVLVAASKALGIVWTPERVWGGGLLVSEENRLKENAPRVWRTFVSTLPPPSTPPMRSDQMGLASLDGEGGDRFALKIADQGLTLVRSRPGTRNVSVLIADISGAPEDYPELRKGSTKGLIELHGRKYIEGEEPAAWSLVVRNEPGALKIVSSAATPSTTKTRARAMDPLRSAEGFGPVFPTFASDVYVSGMIEGGSLVLRDRPVRQPWELPPSTRQ